MTCAAGGQPDTGGDISNVRAQSLLADIDRICGQFALALHNSEPYVYAALTIAVVFGVSRNDPDQV